MPALDKIFDRTEINANNALLKMLVEWEALQLDIRDMRVRVANSLKIYGGDMIKQEAGKLLRKNKEIYCPLELI